MNRYLRWKWRELANQDDERKREEAARYRLTHRSCAFSLLIVVFVVVVFGVSAFMENLLVR